MKAARRHLKEAANNRAWMPYRLRKADWHPIFIWGRYISCRSCGARSDKKTRHTAVNRSAGTYPEPAGPSFLEIRIRRGKGYLDFADFG